MTLNRTRISYGTNSTVPDVTWENEFINKINHILENVADIDLFSNYIRGYNITWKDDSTIEISKGCCVDDTGLNSLILTRSITVSTTFIGDGGLDNSLSNNKFYYVWVVQHEKSKRVSAILSLSDTTPALPSGFLYKRLIGAIRIQSGGTIRQFFQKGTGNQREFFFSQATNIHSSSTPSNGNFVNADASEVVPLSDRSRIGYFEVYMRGTLSGDTVPSGNGNVLGEIRHGENPSGNEVVSVLMRVSSSETFSGDASGTAWLTTSSTGNIRYRRNGVDSGEGTPRVEVRCLGFRINV